MRDFWRLISLFLGLGAFLITGIILLMEGESFHVAIVKAVLAFVSLFVVQNMLGEILVAAADSHQSGLQKTPSPQDNSKVVQNQG